MFMGREKEIYLSVVIPAYNEERSIKSGSLDIVYQYLKGQDYTWEVVVADDGSTDGTVDLVKEFVSGKAGFRVLEEPHRGKGGTVIAGMLAARGEIILFTDMDQSTPIKQVEDFLVEFRRGADVVIGRRKGRKGAPMVRKVMAFGFAMIRTVVLRLPFADTQCGFKAFRKEAAEDIFGQMRSYIDRRDVKGAAVQAGFDIELLFIARKKGYKIVDVEVEWNYGERRKVNPMKDSIEALRDIVRIRVSAMRGKYKE